MSILPEVFGEDGGKKVVSIFIEICLIVIFVLLVGMFFLLLFQILLLIRLRNQLELSALRSSYPEPDVNDNEEFIEMTGVRQRNDSESQVFQGPLLPGQYASSPEYSVQRNLELDPYAIQETVSVYRPTTTAL